MSLFRKYDALRSTGQLAATLGALAAIPLHAEPDFEALRSLDYREEGGGLQNRILADFRAEGLTAAWEEALLAVALDPDATIDGRRLACQLLGFGPSAEAATALEPLLADPRLSHDARLVLERIPDPAADEVLLRALEATTGAMREGVINTLARRRTAAAVPALLSLAEDTEDARTLTLALRAAAAIGSPEAIDYFLKADLKGSGPRTRALRMGAASLLEPLHAGLSDSQIKRLSRRLRDADLPAELRATGLRAGLRQDPDKLGLVLPLLESEDAAERELGATLLPLLRDDAKTVGKLVEAAAKLPPEAQITVLASIADRGLKAGRPLARQALESEDEELRAAALQTLGAIGEAADVELLLPLIEAGAPVEDAARNALARLPDPAASERLMSAFQDPSFEYRDTLVEVIAERGLRDEVGTLMAAAEEADRSLADDVYRALGELGRMEELPVLLDRIRSAESRRRSAIERAVIGIGRRYPEGAVTGRLIPLWEEADEAMQTSLLRMVGAIGDPAALEFVLPFVDRPEPHSLALRLISGWRDPSAFPELERLVQREDWPPRAREAVWSALCRMARNSMEEWTSDRIDHLDACFTHAPTLEDRRALIKEAGRDWVRVEVADWLATLEDPELAGLIEETRQDLLRQLGED